jgi:hypothetical protein
MIVQVREGGACRLAEAEVFDSFKAELAGGVQPSGQPACGVWDEGGAHLWVDAEWLRAQGPSSLDWGGKLDQMLAYAGRKGWLDARGRVRAHVERA